MSKYSDQCHSDALVNFMLGGGGGGRVIAPSKCLKGASLGTFQKRKGTWLFFSGYSKIRKLKYEQSIANNLEFQHAGKIHNQYSERRGRFTISL